MSTHERVSADDRASTDEQASAGDRVTLNGRVSAVVIDEGTATRAGDAAAPHCNVKAAPTIGREAAKGETSSSAVAR